MSFLLVLGGHMKKIIAGDTSLAIFGRCLRRWRRINRRRWHKRHARSFANPDPNPNADSFSHPNSHAYPYPYAYAHASSFLFSDRC